MAKKLVCAFMAVMLLMSFTACQAIEKIKDTIPGNNTETDGENPPVVYVQKEINPLTGLPLADGLVAGTRPIAVMVNNAAQAMPQRGVRDADIIYEAVTEGGITRLMALYSDIRNISTVGPVRSARDQFIQLMLPLNAIYVHIGTSTSAKRMLNFYSYQDIDGIYLGSQAFYYDSELGHTKASEHCWFTTCDLIRAGIDYERINTSGNFYPAFQFVDYEEQAVQLGEENRCLHVDMSYSDYAHVTFDYDANSGKYLKTAFDVPHIDGNNGQQLAFDNIIVIFTKMGIQEENGILPDFDFSQGKGYYIYGGNCIEITWTKGQPEEPLILRDAQTDELVHVNTGKSYVGVLNEELASAVRLYGDEQ